MNQHRLRICLDVRGENRQVPSFLPVNVIDARGQILSTGLAHTQGYTELRYKRGDRALFARLTLPNGTTETVALQASDRSWLKEIKFSIGYDATTSEWMVWSTLRLDMKQRVGALLSQPGMKDAWFQLWEKIPESPNWRQVAIEKQLEGLPQSDDAIQLELRPSAMPRALVVRLDNDTPQVVSLPIHETKVLVTSLRSLSGVVAPRVVVGGYSPAGETIMEFLAAGKLTPVESMLDPGSELAYELLHDKVVDPIAATAAAYYLLRKREWDRMPLHWLDNLANWYEGIPDAKLIRAMSRIERGMPMSSAANLAVETLSHFSALGMPLFAEAFSLLSDLLALAEKAEQPLDKKIAKALRLMLASSRPAGLSFGFEGKTPDKPTVSHQASQLPDETFSRQLIAKNTKRQFVTGHPTGKSLSKAQASERSNSKLRMMRGEALTLVTASVKTLPQREVSGNVTKTLFLKDIFASRPLITR